VTVVCDDELLRQIESGQLPLDRFGHAEHVRLAWLHLRRHTLLQAIARFRATLRAFAAAHDKHGLYHETVTLAFLLLIHERMGGEPEGQAWEQFQARHADLLAWPDNPIFNDYPRDMLADPIARERFVVPAVRSC
jgi:hypothetical protein